MLRNSRCWKKFLLPYYIKIISRKQLKNTIYYFVAFLPHVKSIVVRWFCVWSTFPPLTWLVCMNWWESWEMLIFFVYRDTILCIIFFLLWEKPFSSLCILIPWYFLNWCYWQSIVEREKLISRGGSKNFARCNWLSFLWLPYWILKEAITRKVGKRRSVLKTFIIRCRS